MNTVKIVRVRQRLIYEAAEGIVREAECVAQDLRLNAEDVLGAWLIDVLHPAMRTAALLRFKRNLDGEGTAKAVVRRVTQQESAR